MQATAPTNIGLLLALGLEGLGFKVQSLGFRMEGLGFKV